MDYSKLNNIAASVQDVENATSIVENRLNTKIDEDIQSIQDAISDIGNNPSESIDSNIISAALNDLSDKTDNLTKDVEDLERVTSSSLNDLDEKVDTNEKAVSAALNDLDDKIGYEIKTTNNITNPIKNTYYDLTNSAISTLDITNVSINNVNEIVILFLTSSSCTITALTTQRVLGSTSLASNTVYIMSIVRGVVCIVEAPLYVTPQSE